MRAMLNDPFPYPQNLHPFTAIATARQFAWLFPADGAPSLPARNLDDCELKEHWLSVKGGDGELAVEQRFRLGGRAVVSDRALMKLKEQLNVRT